MLEHLKRIIQRLKSSPPRLPPSAPPDGPDARVRHPTSPRRPLGSLSAAVEEPDDQATPAAAIGRR